MVDRYMEEGLYLGNKVGELPRWLVFLSLQTWDKNLTSNKDLEAPLSLSSPEGPRLMDWLKADQDMFTQQLWANQPPTLN